jgi:hypothetical protein
MTSPSTTVASHMVSFGQCLSGTRRCTSDQLHTESLALATTLRQRYLSTSRLSADSLAKLGEDYTRQP